MARTAKPTRESKIEADFRARCAEIGVLAMKFTSPSYAGVPDRLVIGRHLDTGEPAWAFAEIKAPGAKPRPRQKAVIRHLRQLGAKVAIIDSAADTGEFLHRVFGAPPRATDGTTNTDQALVNTATNTLTGRAAPPKTSVKTPRRSQ